LVLAEASISSAIALDRRLVMDEVPEGESNKLTGGEGWKSRGRCLDEALDRRFSKDLVDVREDLGDDMRSFRRSSSSEVSLCEDMEWGFSTFSNFGNSGSPDFSPADCTLVAGDIAFLLVYRCILC
jgi:hypothetical protein